jgi:hypothetical protein
LIYDFAGGVAYSFASFRQLAASWQATDLFGTQSAGQRCPPVGESRADYASLLFEAIVRRLVREGQPFHVSLGALYLLLLLHELQPWRPRAPVPVLETQWHAFEALAYQLRTSRHADGFAALHALWHGGRLEHRAGERNSVNAADVEAEDEAERAAKLLPSRLGVGELGPSRYAECLREALPSMYEAEAAYDKALSDVLRDDDATRPAPHERRHAGAHAGAPPPPPPLDRSAAVAPPLQDELRQYRSGRRWPAAAARTSAGAGAEGGGAHHSRRDAVRHRPYAPKSGGRRHSQSSRADGAPES